METKLFIRGCFSLFKYPIFIYACNGTTLLKIKRDIGRLLRKPQDRIGRFETFCRVLQNENIATIFLARIKERSFAYRFSNFFFRSNKNIEILTPSNKIGSGLIVYHNLGAVLRAKEIGDDVTISQGVTIGAGGGWNNTDPNNIPTVGNRVLIATNAIVIGNISIGDDAIIGAGAVITKDVPPGVVVVGNPQRIIKKSVDCK